MRERAIKRIMEVTKVFSLEYLNEFETDELLAFSYDIEKLKQK